MTKLTKVVNNTKDEVGKADKSSKKKSKKKKSKEEKKMESDDDSDAVSEIDIEIVKSAKSLLNIDVKPINGGSRSRSNSNVKEKKTKEISKKNKDKK